MPSVSRTIFQPAYLRMVALETELCKVTWEHLTEFRSCYDSWKLELSHRMEEELFCSG